MSHYTVCVVTEDGNYEKALEPFDENLSVEPYIDETKAQIVERIKKRKERYDKDISEGETDSWFEEHYGNVDWNNDDSILRAYMEAWKDDEKFDEEGNHLSTYNPQSKWDWYSLGGRWGGTLKLKKHASVVKESDLTWTNGFEPVEEGYTDFAQVKDIDFTPDSKKRKWAERFWEINVQGKVISEDEYNSGEYRTFYNKKYYKDKYGSKKEFARCNAEFFTYALLYKGQWFEPGQMGWFGCSDTTKDSEKEYRLKFREIISQLKPEDYIAVVDCHI